MRAWILSISATLFLDACAANGDDSPTRYCGDTFCVRSDTLNSAAKPTPVDDFNLYRMTESGQLFVIYEGNQPQLEGEFVRRVTSGFGIGLMFRSYQQIEIRYEGPPGRWPEYLIISTQCSHTAECGIEAFVRSLQRRDASEPDPT